MQGGVVDYWMFNCQQDNRFDLAMMSLKVNYVQLCLFWAYFIYYCEDGHWPPPFKIKIHQGGGSLPAGSRA